MSPVRARPQAPDMLLVKTRIGPSTIHGIGLFAAEFIPKGTMTWRFDRSVDGIYTKSEVDRLAEPKYTEILGMHFAYLSKQTGRYVDCGDDARFMNHADEPNTIEVVKEEEERPNVAARDIQKGEEITIDYGLFAEGLDFDRNDAS